VRGLREETNNAQAITNLSERRGLVKSAEDSLLRILKRMNHLPGINHMIGCKTFATAGFIRAVRFGKIITRA